MQESAPQPTDARPENTSLVLMKRSDAGYLLAKSSHGGSRRYRRTVGSTKSFKVMVVYNRKRHAALATSHKFAFTVSA
jgi:hypothetical protein